MGECCVTEIERNILMLFLVESEGDETGFWNELAYTATLDVENQSLLSNETVENCFDGSVRGRWKISYGSVDRLW
jgi:hypothetical protein